MSHIGQGDLLQAAHRIVFLGTNFNPRIFFTGPTLPTERHCELRSAGRRLFDEP
jgi:hypothetical protein